VYKRQAYSASQRERLKNVTREFHLDTLGRDAWRLSEFAQSDVLVHKSVERQPGEPTATTWQMQQDWEAQRAQFRLTVPGRQGDAGSFRLRIDRGAEIVFPVILRAGESIVCEGTDRCQVLDRSGAVRSTVPLTAPLPILAAGPHTVTLDAERGGDAAPRVELQFRGLVQADSLQARPAVPR
jgi:hypothetical protein